MWISVVVLQIFAYAITDVSGQRTSGTQRVRLITPSPTVLNQGRVEIRSRGVWGTICDTGWDILDAGVVCRELGFDGAQQAVPNGFYSTGDLQPVITNVQCDGREVSLTSCPLETLDQQPCDPGAIAGIVCLPMDQRINLRRKTVTQSTLAGWGDPSKAIDGNDNANWLGKSCTHTALENGPWWKIDLGEEMCITKVEILNRLDCCAFRLIDTIVRIGRNENATLNLQCGGPITTAQAGAGEWALVRCHVPLRGRLISIHGGLGVNSAILTLCEVKIYESQLPCADPASFPQDSKFVRLSNGTTTNNGRIEIYHNGHWGSICHRGWDITDADVVCRDLGFRGANAAIPRSIFGSGNLNISCSNVQCSGEESSIYLCPHDGWGNHDCTSNEIAGVSCYSRGTAISLLDKPVSQSSTAAGGVPERAIDTTYNSYYPYKSCTHTGHLNGVGDIAPWWRIDLQEQRCISEVVIQNRADCCHDRLIDTIVKVGSNDNVQDATRCGLPVTAAKAQPGVLVSIICGRHVPGRYVFVQGGRGTQNAILTICEIEIYEATDSSDCDDELSGNPRVRLVGSNPLRGQVEVYRKGVWGGVCNDNWDLNDAHIVCRDLGSEEAVSALTEVPAPSNPSNYQIWMDNVQCTGEEPSIHHCPHDGWGNYDCTTEQMAGVECAPRQNVISLYGKHATQSSIGAGGVPERAIDGSTNAIYNQRSCSHTGSDANGDIEHGPWWSVDLEEHYCINKVILVNRQGCCPERLVDTIVRVGNNETFWNNPLCGLPVTEEQASPGAFVTIACWQPLCGRYVSVHGGLGINEAWLTLCEVMVYSTDCEGQCDSDTVPLDDSIHIRLVNGRADYEGRVEVYHDNAWGSICDGAWDFNDADVVCKQLGFEGAIHALGGSYFGANNGEVWLNNVQCTGHEESFFNCPHDGWDNQDCAKNHIAGAKCIVPKFEVSILGKPTSQSTTSRDGNAEKAADGNTDTNFYGSSCIQTNDWQEVGPWWKVDLLEERCITHVVIVNRADCCHDRIVNTLVRVGLSNDTSLNSQCGEPVSSEQAAPGAWIKIMCTQPQCGRYVSIHGGGGTEKAILTMCEVKVFATECPEMCRLHHGPIDGNFVRLTDGANELEGRVEIYHHREWRAVCGTGWDINDANVVCRELGFLGATNALQSSQFATGEELVWMSNVQCTGDEGSLSQCQHDGWGPVGNCPNGLRAAIMTCGIVSMPVSLTGNHVTQSSVSNGGEARLAIDGNTDPDFNEGSCIHTAGDENPDVPAWWGIDFDTVRCVSRVDIRNRQDCCHDRLVNAIVLIGDSNDISSDNLWACGSPVNAIAAQPGHWVSVSCVVPILGRYLFIVGGFGVQESTLNFCEVKVYEAESHSACDISTSTTPKPLTSISTVTKTTIPTKLSTDRVVPGPGDLYCQDQVLPLPSGRFTWHKTIPGNIMGSDEKCQGDSRREGQPKAMRYCTFDDGRATWMEPVIVSCDDVTTIFPSTTNNSSSLPEVQMISAGQMVPVSGRIGCIVTTLILVFTLVVLFIFTNFRQSIAHIVQINYCISLLLFNFIFAIGINAKDMKEVCIVVATLLHLFILATVTWLAVDLRHVYLSISHKIKERYFIAKSCLLAWGMPALTSAVTLGISFHRYENIGITCFVTFGPGLLYGIILPVILLLLFMLYASCIIIHELRQRNNPARETVACISALQRFKTDIILAVLTTAMLCSIFAYLNMPSSATSALFCIADITLGISVPILFCCYQAESRNRMQTAIFRTQNPTISNLSNDDLTEDEKLGSIRGVSNPLLDDNELAGVELQNVENEQEA